MGSGTSSSFGKLYDLADEEGSRLNDFNQELSSVVAGYIHTSIQEDINGVPMYLGEDVGDKKLAETVDTAQEALRFSEARSGQLAYASQELSSQNGFKHYDVGDESCKASELADMISDQIQNFEDFEDKIEYNLEVVMHHEDAPVDVFDPDDFREIPDFDIDDWKYPRENLWPF